MATTYDAFSKCRYAPVSQRHGAKYCAESAWAKGSCQRLYLLPPFSLFASSGSPRWQTIEIIGSLAVLNMHISRGWPNEYWETRASDYVRKIRFRSMHYEIASYRIYIYTDKFLWLCKKYLVAFLIIHQESKRDTTFLASSQLHSERKNEGRYKNCFRKISHRKLHNLFLGIYCNIMYHILKKKYLLRFIRSF